VCVWVGLVVLAFAASWVSPFAGLLLRVACLWLSPVPVLCCLLALFPRRRPVPARGSALAAARVLASARLARPVVRCAPVARPLAGGVAVVAASGSVAPVAVPVVFAGSRSLPASASALVSGVVVRCVAAGVPSFSVGCASGADLAALSALVRSGVAPRVSVFAVGSAAGAGFWSCSAPLWALSGSAAAGASVSWLAGGPLSVPLSSRLARRSLACVGSVPAGSVFCAFLSSPFSRGSLLSARAAVARGLRVVVFCCGFAPSALPSLGVGRWVSVPSSSAFAGGFCWAPGA
jgi:hypothetical protein